MSPEERLLRVIVPGTKPKVVYDQKMLMVYDEDESAVGCFYSIEELANFLGVPPQKISQALYRKNKLNSKYVVRWVRINNKKNRKIINKGEF